MFPLAKGVEKNDALFVQKGRKRITPPGQGGRQRNFSLFPRYFLEKAQNRGRFLLPEPPLKPCDLRLVFLPLWL